MTPSDANMHTRLSNTASTFDTSFPSDPESLRLAGQAPAFRASGYDASSLASNDDAMARAFHEHPSFAQHRAAQYDLLDPQTMYPHHYPSYQHPPGHPALPQMHPAPHYDARLNGHLDLNDRTADAVWGAHAHAVADPLHQHHVFPQNFRPPATCPSSGASNRIPRPVVLARPENPYLALIPGHTGPPLQQQPSQTQRPRGRAPQRTQAVQQPQFTTEHNSNTASPYYRPQVYRQTPQAQGNKPAPNKHWQASAPRNEAMDRPMKQLPSRSVARQAVSQTSMPAPSSPLAREAIRPVDMTRTAAHSSASPAFPAMNGTGQMEFRFKMETPNQPKAPRMRAAPKPRVPQVNASAVEIVNPAGKRVRENDDLENERVAKTAKQGDAVGFQDETLFDLDTFEADAAQWFMANSDAFAADYASVGPSAAMPTHTAESFDVGSKSPASGPAQIEMCVPLDGGLSKTVHVDSRLVQGALDELLARLPFCGDQNASGGCIDPALLIKRK